MLGLPWFVAATVLSINHVIALKLESETAAPGEKAKFLGVREQRVTGFVVFLFIGLSVFLTKFLGVIPMPVLYGVFMYMGVSALRNMQVSSPYVLVLRHANVGSYLDLSSHSAVLHAAEASARSSVPTPRAYLTSSHLHGHPSRFLGRHVCGQKCQIHRHRLSTAGRIFRWHADRCPTYVSA